MNSLDSQYFKTGSTSQTTETTMKYRLNLPRPMMAFVCTSSSECFVKYINSSSTLSFMLT